MIHKVFSDNKQFREVNFSEGLNIVLGVKTETSNDTDTMNGVGKTTLLEVIDFCFGSNIDKNSYLKKIKEIEDWNFSIDIDIFNSRYIISRSIKKQNKIYIDGDINNLTFKPNKDDKGYYFKLKDWRNYLGVYFFGLDDYSFAFMPTFRSLMSYFIRKHTDSYNVAFEHHKKQMNWDVQVNTAFLIGLNWKIPSQFQSIRQEFKSLKKDLKKFDKSTLGEIETKKINLENDLNKKNERLSTFNVHENYAEIENQANQLSNELQHLSNTNMILKRKLNSYNDSISNEIPLNDHLDEFYEEIGDVFNFESKKTLNEVRLFHNELIKNRKSFLNVEILEIKKEIEDNEELITQKGQKRAKLMEILETHNALEEFKLLQHEIYDEKIEVDNLRKSIDDYHEVKNLEKKLNKEKNILKEKNERDYEVMRSSWQESIELFNENTRFLYGLNGELIIDLKEAYDFKINFPKGDSRGVSKMEIFCYDLMLLEKNSVDKNIDFLIHDSEIFSDVDSRQVAKAFQLVLKKCGENLQYIVTLNSDELDKIKQELPNDFDLDKYIKLKLSDNVDEKHLLGFVFD